MRSRAVRRLHRHLDGRRVVSYLTIAVQAEGREVRTIEDVAAEDGTLHPLQSWPAIRQAAGQTEA
jgi:aerobic-type carbon monoxide dehydrogenase small subunit (CoxS/CutS family)